MILTLLATTVLVVLVCAVVVGLYVVPFVRTVDMGERRGFSTARVGALALLLALASLGFGYLGIHAHALLIPAALLSWAGPAVVALLAPGSRGLGCSGAHEA